MTRVLAAGDRFVLNSLFADALRREIPSQEGSGGLEIRELDLPWPDEPMAEFLDGLTAGAPILPPDVLFGKITDEQIAVWEARFGGPETP